LAAGLTGKSNVSILGVKPNLSNIHVKVKFIAPPRLPLAIHAT
jgi:hypothetical protein